jgi:hypothetical protein
MAEARSRSKRAQKSAPSTPVCPVALCPIGMFLSVTGEVRPDVVEHFLSAGRELMAAVRATMDTRAEEVSRSQTLERIDVE